MKSTPTTSAILLGFKWSPSPAVTYPSAQYAGPCRGLIPPLAAKARGLGARLRLALLPLAEGYVHGGPKHDGITFGTRSSISTSLAAGVPESIALKPARSTLPIP